MKTTIKLAAFVALLILFSDFKSKGDYKESRVITGPSVVTESLHNAIMGAHDGNVYREFANAWFKRYTLTVSAPDGWYFTGKPYINCVKDDQGACGWNKFAEAHDRFYITEQSPNFLKATVWAGSRSIEINLACEATRE